VNPLNMSIITTIQATYKIVYGFDVDFEELEHKTYEQLEQQRDALLPKYNKQVKENN